MKKATLLAFTLATLTANALADDVTFTINGRILPKTCTATTPNGTTINMVDKFVDDFGGQANREVDGTNTGSLRFSCPATTNIAMSVEDALEPAVTNRQYLKSNGTAQNVGVKLRFLRNNTEIADVNNKNLKSINRLYTGTGTNFTTNQNLDFVVKPYYYSITTAVTPGTVRAQAKLTFTYP